ncbi:MULTISPECIES: hypothetical protein [Stenotrophomonas]|uniref:hypothetical protein n=1 Tax=Stenotrophomonas TaxID=40323 RepID=UPI00066B0F5D|nr:hypothetical protein [Stenotrophomonas maltophilia]
MTKEVSAAHDRKRADCVHLIRSVISEELVDTYYTYARQHLMLPGYFKMEPEYLSMSRYADGLGEALLEKLTPRIGEALGRDVLPSYSFLRFYTHGSVLSRHIDRPACEITATLALGPRVENPWPIHVLDGGVEKTTLLSPGDILVFRGAKLPHWRDAYPGEHCLQLFLHYVFKDGDFSDYKYDKREYVGPLPMVAVTSDAEASE